MKNRIKASGGIENDAFSSWRHYLCYLTKPKIRKWAKTKYNKRLRKKLKEAQNDE